MAVTDSPSRPVTHNGAGPPVPHAAGTPAAKGPGGWIKSHKAVAGLGAAGVVILLVSHKGAKAGGAAPGAAADTAQNAAAEQAAIDQAVGAGTGIAGGVNPGDGGGGVSGGGGDNGDGTPDPTGGLTDPGSGSQPQPITINVGPNGVNTPAPKKTIKGKIKAGGKTTHKPAHTPTKKAHVPPAHKPAHKPAPAHHPAPKAGAHKPPAPKHPAKKTVPKRKGHGSVVKFGRFFDGAQGVHVGPAHVTSDGVVHEPVTVNFGGYTETHMSHNRGEGWTDFVPGYSPPSRGVPIVRAGTPTLVGADEDE